jgi:hypothetical protein
MVPTLSVNGLGVGLGVGLGAGFGVGSGFGVGDGVGVGVGVGLGVGVLCPVGLPGLDPLLPQPEIVMATPLSIASAASTVNVRRSRFLASWLLEGIRRLLRRLECRGRAG